MNGRARVVATWPLSELAAERLRQVADRIEDISNEKLSSEELAKRLHDADGLIIFPLTTRIDSTVLSGAKRLKVVATVAVGYDNIDLRACAERGIKVGNTPLVIAPATADIGMALILATMRRIIPGVEWVKSGRWEREALPYGNDLARKTLGIFGMGAVGAALAHRARAAGMKIIYYNRNPRSDVDPTEATYVSFDELLRRSDVVAVTAPLTPETRGIFGAEAFAKMKRGAYFVNVARGGLVQTDALYEALRSGHLAYAGLDVTDPEPLPAGHPLRSAPNCFITPHLAGGHQNELEMLVRHFLENFDRFLKGEPLRDRILSATARLSPE